MTTLASVSLSLSREHQEHRARMVGPLAISLGSGLATYSLAVTWFVIGTLAAVLELCVEWGSTNSTATSMFIM